MSSNDIVGTIFVCLFGSGGIVLWLLNRHAKKVDAYNERNKDIAEIKKTMHLIQEGLIVALENDKVIFAALRTHEINGESEEQEKRMDQYFLSLLKEKGGTL